MNRKEYYKKNRKTILDNEVKRRYYNFINEYRIKGRYIKEDKIFTKKDINYINKINNG